MIKSFQKGYGLQWVTRKWFQCVSAADFGSLQWPQIDPGKQRECCVWSCLIQDIQGCSNGIGNLLDPVSEKFIPYSGLLFHPTLYPTIPKKKSTRLIEIDLVERGQRLHCSQLYLLIYVLAQTRRWTLQDDTGWYTSLNKTIHMNPFQLAVPTFLIVKY